MFSTFHLFRSLFPISLKLLFPGLFSPEMRYFELLARGEFYILFAGGLTNWNLGNKYGMDKTEAREQRNKKLRENSKQIPYDFRLLINRKMEIPKHIMNRLIVNFKLLNKKNHI